MGFWLVISILILVINSGFWGSIFILAFMATIVFLIQGIIFFKLKNGNAKKLFKVSGVTFSIFIISLIFVIAFDSNTATPTPSTTAYNQKEAEKAKEETEEAKKEAEEQARIAAEEKAKQEAEEKAKKEAEEQARVAAEEKAKQEAEEQARIAAEEKAKQEAGTMSQQQAVKKAEDYIDHTAFSRSGLIEQLVFEGFSNSDAS
ncbi:Ltp family lipoprotein, partial [Domibacillus tundrae]|uniref:Ltp family lipoprotein n=1 Tax=Domibacillus tundrae TaxID=1587527 RepID=UPI0006977D71